MCVGVDGYVGVGVDGYMGVHVGVNGYVGMWGMKKLKR